MFLALTFATPSWRYGPFTWLPLWRAEEIAGAPVTIGVFNLLPLMALAGLLAGRVGRAGGGGWQWGRREVTRPLLGLTGLGLFSLTVQSPRLLFIHAGGWAMAWLVYLYVLNERPFLPLPLAFILLIQGGDALAQFFLQRDVGLVGLGELPLNPAFSGVTVLWARGARWLRAYGLTAHPNLLGAALAVILLLLWPRYGRCRGWRRVGLGMALAVGSAGLFVSFSRAAWLGFAVGLAAWAILVARETGNAAPFKSRLLLPLIPALLLSLAYGDLVLSRFVALDTPIEARSLDERVSDSRLALALIADHPWRGVGLGNYTDYAQTMAAGARRVHNVLLLVTAELGLPGGLLWLWLALAPLLAGRRSKNRALSKAVWLAMLAMSQLDTMVWVSGNWQTAVLFALLAANMTVESTLWDFTGFGRIP